MMTDDKTYMVIDDTQWYRAIRVIRDHVRQFRRLLENHNEDTDDVNYIQEWIEFYSNVDEHRERLLKIHVDDDDDGGVIEPNWREMVQFLFADDVNTVHEFINEVLKIIPPVRYILEVIKMSGTPNKYVLQQRYYPLQSYHYNHQLTLHRSLCNNDKTAEDKNNKSDVSMSQDSDDNSKRDKSDDINISFASSLQNQVQEMEDKLDTVTKELQCDLGKVQSEISSINSNIGNINETIQMSIARAIADAFTNTNKEMNDAIKAGTREIEKMTGEIKSATVQVESLKSKAATLKNNASQAEEKATKAYISAKTQMDSKKNEIEEKLQEALETAQEIVNEAKAAAVTTKIPTSIPPKYYKNYGDSFTIAEQEYQVRSKKFIDDETPIQCDNGGEFLTTYELLKEIASPYGILLTQLDMIGEWDKTYMTAPPTCPYDPSDCDSMIEYDKAYSMMSLALSTKLRNKVKFGDKFLAAKLAVNRFSNDGYKMLYDILITTHPKLKRNKATKPSKPQFLGDIAEYINKLVMIKRLMRLESSP